MVGAGAASPAGNSRLRGALRGAGQIAFRLRYVIQAERANVIDETLVREALAGAFDAVWRPELVQGATRGRDPELTEATSGDPLAALDRYMAARPELAPRREELLERARTLIEEASA